MVRISAFADEISKDPVEQLDVLESHGIRHIEFRSIHGINVLDLSDAQHEEFRPAQLPRLRPECDRLTDRQNQDHRSVRRPSPALDLAMDLAEFLQRPSDPDLQLLHAPRRESCPPSGRDPGADGRAWPPRAARGITLLLENEKGIFGDTARACLDILETVNSPSLSARL